MTAIAAFKIADQPFLISDVLVTRGVAGRPPTPIPVVGDLEWTRSHDSGVAGLASKVMISPDGRLAMCWAGSVPAIAQAYESLATLGRSGGLTVKSARRFLRECAALGINAIGWMYDDEEFHLLAEGTHDLAWLEQTHEA